MRACPRLPRGTRGFSLLEVMVSVLLLGAGIVAMAPMVNYATQRATVARRETAAALIGAQILESLRAEIQHDPGRAGAGTHGGLNGTGGVLTGLDQMWNAVALPHSSLASMTAPLPANTPPGGCRADAAGSNDFAAGSTVGPFLVRHEAEDFFVCYNLRPSAAPCPGPICTIPVIVKVLWVNPDQRVLARRLISSIAVIGG